MKSELSALKAIDSQYVFFTGKGGVGKTSTACAFAVLKADSGKKVLLVSTDPASNLQDVFERPLSGEHVAIEQVPGLYVANLNPEEAARNYRESVISPYRGKFPESVIKSMEEQLSGSCTIEIAAFNQFSDYIASDTFEKTFDHIVFDTAPTGHTLRMLSLPLAWTGFIEDATHGTSCLGQLSGLEERKDLYKVAVSNLANEQKTSLVLVTRPEDSALSEAKRSSEELSQLGIQTSLLVINGLLPQGTDPLSQAMCERQNRALASVKAFLEGVSTCKLPLKNFNVLGVDRLRAFLTDEDATFLVPSEGAVIFSSENSMEALAKRLFDEQKKVIFTMGKGGVGKTTVALKLAQAMAKLGQKVHLASTDPAANLKELSVGVESIRISRINEKDELLKYQKEVIDKARETMSEEDISFIEEDLRSPCTQEIAVFRAFAELVYGSEGEVVIIDTAPTGHTLLLLDATQSFHREVERTKGETPESIRTLLPKLRDPLQTEVLIVTLPEATPVYEAQRLLEDLKRAGIESKWWIVNQCLRGAVTTDPLLLSRRQLEITWLEQVDKLSLGHTVTLDYEV